MSDYITPVLHVDPSGESFLLVAGAVFLGGLIGGLIGVFTATDDEKLLGAFVGGFINGAICTVGLAAAIATGGTSAFAIAGVSGFFGGFVGNSINQLISGSDYNFGNALFSGGVSAIANMAALWGFNQFLTPIGTTWGKRFVEAILPSTIGVAIQVYNGLHIRDPFIYSKKSHFSHLREESNNIVIDFA
jgi:hypothetical protein